MMAYSGLIPAYSGLILAYSTISGRGHIKKAKIRQTILARNIYSADEDLRGKKVERLGRGQNAQWRKLGN